MEYKETHDLIKELGTNFIEYAAAVNTDRAIPDATSGLKPVARRILYDAFDSGFISSKPHVKCAKIVGSVIGTLHPHGDTSVYEALVRLAQPWVMRYPLIDFHGNLGNVGGDGPAHYRYTEARTSKITEEGLLAGIKKNNVTFIDNFDETRLEPITLPAIFPNLLCNPNMGIGVAMACNWLPHNLREVADAIFAYMDGERDLYLAPDFPTGGLIVNKSDIPAISRAGRGSIKVRGKYDIEKQNIIFYELPYGVSTEALMTEIGELCEKKELEGIEDIRDESNKKGMRIVIECERGVDPASLINKLFAKTDLQVSISYNQVALVNKTPTELGLLDCIKIYIEHNIDCLIRECNFDLTKVQARKEIVEGLLRALEDIDTIIALIKKSSSASAAKDALIEKYQFTEPQAKAIVDMKLGKLAGLEKIELQNEYKDLCEEEANLIKILSSKEVQLQTIRERLSTFVKKFGDDRRTEISQIDISTKEKEIETVIPEDCVIILTQAGNIKRIPATAFKTQRRNGKGVKTEDDAIFETISTNTIDTLMVFTNTGKMYRLLVDNIPVGTNASKGVRIGTLIKFEAGEEVVAITSLYRKTDAEFVLFVTKQGLIKKTTLEEYTKTKRSTGIAAIKLNEGDSIANVTFVKDEELVVITKQGMSIRFTTTDINAIGRVTSGVKGIKLNEGDEVLIGLPIHNKTDSIGVFSTSGHGKKVALNEFTLQGRGGKGVMLYKGETSFGEIAGAAMICDEDNLLLIGKPNSICISATEIPQLVRTSLGNIMIKDSQIYKVLKI